MEIFLSGLIIWALVHLSPSMIPSLKAMLLEKWGLKSYKFLFTSLTILSMLAIIYGWRHSSTTFLYQLSPGFTAVAYGLILLAFLLFAASIIPSRLLRIVRHPQLMFIISLSIAHLLLSGDSRSVILFSVLCAWAVLEIILINKRDGLWIKKLSPALIQEVKLLVLGLVLFAAAGYGHRYLSGVSIPYF